MADDDFPPRIRLMNFVSEEQLDEAKRNRGARVEDGTAQRDRSLYEILKENKDKKDAEFNERFKHRPPKALDEDETEFLEKLEMSRREYEKQMADEEAQELQGFHAAVAAQSIFVQELKETPPVTEVQEQKLVGKKNLRSRPSGMIVKVKPQAKKAKKDQTNSVEPLEVVRVPNVDKTSNSSVSESGGGINSSCLVSVSESGGGINSSCLVSYSDESDEE